MLPILEQLLVIQDRDRRIAELKREQARVPQQLEAVDARVRDESTRLESARQELKHIETERKKLEIEAESKRSQILKYRGQLSLIKSNTEYQALLKEIAKADGEIREIEDRELDFMERAELIQSDVKQEQALVKELTSKAEAEKADLQKRAAAIAQELTSLQSERKKLADTTDPDALSRYGRLMHSKGDYAVVPIRNGNCGGCHLHIPPQVVHNAKHGDELTSCEYCGRILYWQPE
ncbi:MAG TPA: C4-type zinc ribbon domain-containing protein [Verrucomicrobiae bacterium]|nr:C4-type zinc ribbon domain-containing protein [Verrucomicrobiae bacterium]